ncbi:uncharacterized protein LOC113496868 [Trichoplusia ni]|uniref:Uncharacterized protein LOC113496868 n=1 Tax=Trichoplusia ni TaxID=7111 RepID=A0A7E5VUM7_TRINI|nr:uncharacterized protein LOC113496868 [Trichoplusia ni]XP_026732038.1 uncharacterized protein LOC113496868 [Trichoplusia ni]XP_026732039.1 uncharacterized protein LOC113496868 [Trichoplusia ni]
MDIELIQETPTVIPNATSIVKRIIEKCKYEADSNMLAIPLQDVEARVSDYTGIPTTKIQQLINKENISNTCFYDFETRIMILKCLLKLYSLFEIPTYRKLFNEMNELKLDIQDYELFKNEVTLLGFEYRTICNSNNQQLLMEDPEITFQRNSYLAKMLKFRESNTLVYYIGERIVDEEKKFCNLSHQNADELALSRNYLVFHAVSRLGSTSCIFTVNATENDYFNWIVDILLERLEPSSVIVLHNSPLLGTPPKPISISDTKNAMYKWLMSHNIPCIKSMSKFQLYDLIKRNPAGEEMSRVERVLKMNGHEVLRLPTHFEDLSVIDLLWKDLEFPVLQFDLKELLLAHLKEIPTTKYVYYENIIVNREVEVHGIDVTLENNLEHYLLRL